MSGLDKVANLVRAVRLGSLALILMVAVGGSWAAMQPGRGYAAAPARSAGIHRARAHVHPSPYFVIVEDGNLAGATHPQTGNAPCFRWVTPDEVNC
jgi:hypothetical protein